MATNTYRPDSTTGFDVFLSQSTPAVNQDGTAELRAGKTGTGSSARRSLLRFDVSDIPSNATIESATLTFTVVSRTGTPSAGTVRRIRRTGWVETQATWNVYATGSSWTTVGCGSTTDDYDTTITGGTHSAPPASGTFDVTGLEALVADAIANRSGMLHLRWALDSESNNTNIFVHSCEATTESNRPLLTVEYSVPVTVAPAAASMKARAAAPTVIALTGVALQAKVGSFVADQTLDQSITDVGFQPKVVIFWFAPDRTADGAGADYGAGVGWAVSSTQRHSLSVAADDAFTADGVEAYSYKSPHASACISLCFDDGTSASAEFTSFDSGGFTINWGGTSGQGAIINYLALAGDEIANVAAGNFARRTSTGTDAITAPGFTPDALLLLMPGSTNTGGGAVATANLMLGWATRDGGYGAVANVVEGVPDPTDTWSLQRNDRVAVNLSATGTEIARAIVSSWDTNGFTLDWDVASASAHQVYWLAIKGGRWRAGELTQPAAAGTQDITGPGWPALAALFASINDTTDASILSNARVSIGGASDASNRGAIWGGGLDNQNPTVMRSRLERTLAIILETESSGSQTENARADYNGSIPAGFQLDWEASDGTGRKVLWLSVSSTRITPDPARFIARSVAPTIPVGSLDITPATGKLVARASAPTVVLGQVTIEPASARLFSRAVEPTTVQGPVSAEPTPSMLVLRGADPIVEFGATTVEPATGRTIVRAGPPEVILGPVTVAPATARTIARAVAPSITLGPSTVQPAVARALARAVAPSVVTGVDAVAAYGCDEGGGTNVRDATGHGHNGTLGGTATWTASGQFGAALSFPNASGLVTVPHHADLSVSALTIEAWVYPTSNNYYAEIVTKGPNGPPLNYYFDINGGALLFGFYNGNYREWEDTTGGTVPLNQWSHVAVTYSNGTIQFYRGGSPTRQVTGALALLTNTDDLFIGRAFIGRIDEVRIYNRALSSAEIAANYNQRVVPPLDVTPAPSKLVARAVAPTVLAPLVVTPATSRFLARAAAPTVLSPVTLAPAAGRFVARAVAPTVIVGEAATVEPAAASLKARVVEPAVILGATAVEPEIGRLIARAPAPLLSILPDPAHLVLAVTGPQPIVGATARVLLRAISPATPLVVAPAAGHLHARAVAPTVVLGQISVEPATAKLIARATGAVPTIVSDAARLLARAAAPTVVFGEVTVAPAAGRTLVRAVEPTTILGPVVVTAQARTIVRATAPTVELGPASVEPASGRLIARAVEPTVVLGPVTPSLTPARLVAYAIPPTIVYGASSAVPDAAAAVFRAPNPAVILGAGTVEPAAGRLVARAQAPEVVLGATTAEPAAATTIVRAAAPVITIVAGPARLLTRAVEPTVIFGPDTASPAAGRIILRAPPASVILGAGTIEPTPARCLLRTVAPVVELGASTAEPAAGRFLTRAVAPTVVLGEVAVTPAVATTILRAAAPLTDTGAISPAAGRLLTRAIAPTVTLGPATAQPAAGRIVARAVAPEVVYGPATITPATAARFLARAVAPGVLFGAITPAPARLLARAVAPAIHYGATTAAPNPGRCLARAAAPSVVLGPIGVEPARARLLCRAAAPQVVLGPITPATGRLLARVVAPAVLLGATTAEPASGRVVCRAVAPTVTFGEVAVIPAAARAFVRADAPTVLLGASSSTPQPARFLARLGATTVFYGATSAAPTPTSTIVRAVAPYVRIGVPPPPRRRIVARGRTGRVVARPRSRRLVARQRKTETET